MFHYAVAGWYARYIRRLCNCRWCLWALHTYKFTQNTPIYYGTFALCARLSSPTVVCRVCVICPLHSNSSAPPTEDATKCNRFHREQLESFSPLYRTPTSGERAPEYRFGRKRYTILGHAIVRSFVGKF